MKNIENKKRKYFEGRAYHRDYFETIDTQEKAYILGFLWGDGSYIASKGTIALAIAVKDRDHLSRMASCLGLDDSQIKLHKSKGFSYRTFDYVKIQMSHQTFFDCLCKKGYAKKAERFRQIPEIPKPLIRHFLRGLFDADGCITSTTAGMDGGFKNVRIEVSLPHMDAALWWRDLFRSELGIDFGIGPDKSIFRVRTGNRSALNAIYDYFYDDSIIALERKETKFRRLLNRNFEPTDPDQILNPAA